MPWPEYTGTVEEKTAYARGFDRGNFGGAYESENWQQWSERNHYAKHSKPYQDGMLMGFFSSYEAHEIADLDIRDQVEALRGTFGAIVETLADKYDDE